MLSRCTEEHTRLTLHRVTVGLALCEFAHTVERGGGDVVERFFGEEGLVRGEHHVRRTEQTCKNIVLNHVVAAVFVEIFLLFFVNSRPAEPMWCVRSPSMRSSVLMS